jgi:bifunctional UDP-N-acetylglucosamine pyrophosphorylase/glucosamine-1-phosphate N-acetyltransferase
MQAVILAAGESSRFWPFNSKHKSLFKIAGKPLIWYAVQNLKEAGVNDIIIVQGQKREVEEELKNYGVEAHFVVQEKPLGTGDAIFQAKPFIEGNFLVVGPHKLDLDKYLPELLRKSGESPEKVILTGVTTETPWDYGILKLAGDKVVEIVENPAKGKEPSNINATEAYVLPRDFFDVYQKVNPEEDSLIEVINIIIKERGAEVVLLGEDSVSLKYPWHPLILSRIFFNSPRFKASVSSSAKISKNVIINGEVFIGENVVVAENTVINGPAYIGNDVRIGAGNILRGPVILEEGVMTGGFFEIKNSLVGRNTHFHSGYVGDSVIGGDCRFGAGFITANRRTDRNNVRSIVKKEKIDTGSTYLGAIVGSRTRFGIHAGTMPGVIIGSDCLVGPGTLVFENVEDDTTTYVKFEKVVEKNK